MKRSLRIWFSLSFGVLVFMGAAAGYWLLRSQAEWLRMSVLVFTVGVLSALVVEEIAP